jgi:hypothetical protein
MRAFLSEEKAMISDKTYTPVQWNSSGIIMMMITDRAAAMMTRIAAIMVAMGEGMA